MTRPSRGENDWDEADDDDHGVFSDSDLDEEDLDEDDATGPCPHCGQSVYEDAVRCPHCENYLSDEEAVAPRKPWWILLGVGICLYLVYRWTLGR